MSKSKVKKSNGVPKGKTIFKNKELAAAYDAFAAALVRHDANFAISVSGNVPLAVDGDMATVFYGSRLWQLAGKASVRAIEQVMEVANVAAEEFEKYFLETTKTEAA